ncbi:hypothetical protein MASR1M101_32770 [Gemmatimonas sp.]
MKATRWSPFDFNYSAMSKHHDALKALVSGPLTHTNYRPYRNGEATGNFDVSCSPGARRLEVKVRVRYNFDKAYTGTEQVDFRRKLVAQVDKYWSSRYRLLLCVDPAKLDLGQKKPGPAYSYPMLPTFTVEESPQTHYQVDIADSKYDRSFVSTDGHCALFRGTADDFQSTLHNKMQHREGLVGKLINKVMHIDGEDAVTHYRQAENRPIAFVANSTDYTTVGKSELGNLGRLLKQELPTWELVTIQVVGHTTKGESATVGVQRADKVRRDLVALGVPAPQLVARASKSPGTAKVPSVMLKLEKDPRAKLVKDAHPWPVAAHEFGHMLGLLDEYIPGNDHNDNDYREFTADCARFGNLAVPRFGVRGTSIMSWGYHVFPAHYVSVARALDEMIASKVKNQLLPRVADHVDFLKAVTVRIDPLPVKTAVEHENAINYLDWIQGAYRQP